MTKGKIENGRIENDAGWCVVAPYRSGNGAFLLFNNASSTRKAAQNKAIEFWGNGNFTWKQLYYQGYRAVRVILTADAMIAQRKET